MPVTPPGSVAAGTVGGGLTTNENERVSDSCALSVTLIVNEKFPVCEGAPVRTPLDDRLRPAGNPLGEIVTPRCAEVLPNVSPGGPSTHE